ncbi:protein kinase [Acidobacteriota bacterium]
MGAVYRVEDTKAKEEIALKLIKPEIAANKKTIERFRNELTTARKIRHKNICGMYDLNEEKGTHYITMEYVPGEDLKSFLRRTGHLTVSKAVSLSKQICEGLSEAHRSGVVHRDLKPANIMIDKSGNARIMDFGIARTLKAKGITGEGVMIGTPEYMSPEQAEAKYIDQRSDLYSLGVILCEMVTGELPFEGDTPLSIAMKHKGEMPKKPKELNPKVPDDLNHVILRCLEKDKEKRYQSSGELRAELENIEKGIPTTDKEIPKKKPLTSKEITLSFGLKKQFVPALIFVGIIIIGVIIWQALPKKDMGSSETAINSIAVLSFDNLNLDADQEYLCVGIPLSIMSALSKINGLRVSGKASSFSFKREDKNIRDISEKLKVQAVLDGSIQRLGNRLRISVQLNDTIDGTLLWSEDYNREEEDLFAIQDGIALSVAGKLRYQLLEEQQSQLTKRDTENVEAYKAYLKGRYYQERRTFDDIQRSAEFFQQALEIDPNYARAYSGLADYYNLISFYGNVRPRDSLPKAEKLALKAIELDDGLAEAHTSLAVILSNWDWDWAGAEREYKRAIELNPSYPLAHGWYGGFLVALGRIDEAIRELELAQELDPLSPFPYALGTYLIFRQENEKALEMLEKGLVLEPNYAQSLYATGLIYLHAGMLEEAIQQFQRALELSSDSTMYKAGLGHAYALAGKKVEALNIYDELTQLAKRVYVPAFHLAVLSTGLGEKDQALAWLKKSLEERDNALYLGIRDFRLNPLSSDPRFQKLIGQMNLPD